MTDLCTRLVLHPGRLVALNGDGDLGRKGFVFSLSMEEGKRMIIGACFVDGRRTRGVLSITVLKELLRVIGTDRRPFEMFDLICGTSTGGIISVLLGTMRMDMESVETLYDNLISKIFGKGSGLKLFTEKAFYDEANWEQVLFNEQGVTCSLLNLGP